MEENIRVQSPLEVFYEKEQSTPDKIFLRQPFAGQWHIFTWQQAGDEIRRIAAAIRALDLPPQSKIGLVSKNCAHWIMADLAIMMSGHISVPLYPNIGPVTLKYVLEHSESKVLFVGKLDGWESMKAGLPDNIHCISFPMYGPEGYTKWEDLLKQYEPIKDNPVPDPDNIMTIVYTSGTTGRPKGVMHNYYAFSYALTNALEIIPLEPSTRFFSYLPLSHVAERMLVEMGVLYVGGEVYFAESLDTFADNLKEAKPTIFLAVPRIWTKFKLGILAKVPQEKLDKLLAIPLLSSYIKWKIKKGLGLHKTKLFFTGASAIPESLLKWFQQIGITIQEVYGMTENCAYSHLNRRENAKFGYVGQPMPHCDVKISEAGEILVRNKCTMLGYYKEPEMTAAVITEDGYLRTGDKGEIDEEGFLKITGRVKDIFKTEKGKYISPAPIEMSLSKNAYIEQVCVVGTNLPQPVALIVLSEDARNKARSSILSSLTETLESTNPTLESHERLQKAIVVKEEWTTDNNLLTPSLKIKRSPIEEKYGSRLRAWYGHDEIIIWEE